MPSGIPVTGASDEFFFRLSRIPRRGMECDLLASIVGGHPQNEKSQGKPLKPRKEEPVRKRNFRVQVRLSEREYQKFLGKVNRTGLSREAYLRHLMNGVVPQGVPPPDYYSFMERLYQVGNLLEQISRQAQALDVVDASQYKEAVGQFHQLVEDITEAVILPRRM